MSNTATGVVTPEMEAVHRKRLSMILRYIADMHQSSETNDSSFLRNHYSPSDFVNDGNILFSNSNFSKIVSAVAGTSYAPFSFYAAANANSNKSKSTSFAGFAAGLGGGRDRKRTASGTLKPSAHRNIINNNDTRSCWLRITRPVVDQPPSSARKPASVRDYLRTWSDLEERPSTELISTVESINRAPKIDPTTVHSAKQEIKSFLKQQRKYLQKKQIRNALEPLYNGLFEWLQESHEEELVWGFGNVRYAEKTDDEASCLHVNGPLFEVLVEVELARDGAILVRPRPHTGVTLNRPVTSAVAPSDVVLAQLHKRVSELEVSQISPGQPSSFVPILKKMVLELSSDGCFVSCSSGQQKQQQARRRPNPFDKLVVSDATCVYPRRKPSAVWARDASIMAEKVLVQPNVPLPAWSLTHGPAILTQIVRGSQATPSSIISCSSMWSSIFGGTTKPSPEPEKNFKPILPLATSETQNQIVEVLMNQKAPTLVVEGPPGTGKTHSIANIVCAYLAQGKRVLVTSKGPAALSVLRERLPKCIQDLCVDVTMSESKGMRQLQQTVERLADRVSCINAGVQEEHCTLLKRSIDELEEDLEQIDAQLATQNAVRRKLVMSPEGREMSDLSISLMQDAPWLSRAIADMSESDVGKLYKQAKKLEVQEGDPMVRVTGFTAPVPSSLITRVAANAGEPLSSVSAGTTKALASIPMLGALTGAHATLAEFQEALDLIHFDGATPKTTTEWSIVARAMRRDQAFDLYETNVLSPLITKFQWPKSQVLSNRDGKKRLNKRFVAFLQKAFRFKQLVKNLNLMGAESDVGLDEQRSRIACQLQKLARDLTEATVVTELSRMFSADAQSALIRFAQVAGKAKFNSSNQASKMSQRQRRHRQEYLEAFERCVRFIPCWIMTSSQISDYLPAELSLFDLVIVDEASQSDVILLPGILRGKQWLIVGDSKQVSPSETFVSEAQIESLRASLPNSPLKESLLPGQSFFDLCAQGFPQGRAVLSEHFRCAPEIISFCNQVFYDEKLTPLRVPTSLERLTPSIIDVKVRGVKDGKSNKKECDVVVKMVKDFVTKDSNTYPRSIGIISLMGDEQSRLIRGRLLDAIGPRKYKEHRILIGEPPNFQGAERDVVFLSMVCSPGHVPTQNQLLHAQRANVALSRARDRMVLVRSIDATEVPNSEDIKVPIIDFFSQHSRKKVGEGTPGRRAVAGVQCILEKLLSERGYSVRPMGIVWADALCVEDIASGCRVAIRVECAGESPEAWHRAVKQQRVIERVGWTARRVDAAQFLASPYPTLESLARYLYGQGIRLSSDEVEDDMGQEEEDEASHDEPIPADGNHRADEPMEVGRVVDDDNIIIVSSDDENGARYELDDDSDDDGDHPGNFGEVANLDFLRASVVEELSDGDEYFEEESKPRAKRKRRKKKAEDDSVVTEVAQSAPEAEEESPGDRREHYGVARLPKNDDDDWSPEE